MLSGAFSYQMSPNVKPGTCVRHHRIGFATHKAECSTKLGVTGGLKPRKIIARMIG